MKKLLIFLLAFTVPLYGFSKKPTYSNPVSSATVADPTIWFDNGTYYLYSTMGAKVKSLMQSSNLISWTGTNIKPFSEETNGLLKTYGSSRWAPDIIKIGDEWNFYITVRDGETKTSGIAVLTSRTATGPFVLKGRITFSGDTGIKDSIDPEVVVDHTTGKVWMFFGSTGKMHRVQLNSSGTALAQYAQYEHVAGLDINDNPSRDKVFEGAYLHWHDGYWYLFCSAGKYWNHTYRIVVGRSKTLDGEFLSKDGGKMTEGHATTILSSEAEDRFFGPGHNSEIITDKRGNDYIFYHCHDRSAGNDKKRFLMLQRIYWGHDGWPYFKGGKPAERGTAPQLP